MSSERFTPEDWGPHLAQAVRAVRKARGLSVAQTAELMGLDRRNYANFEAGKGRLNLARVLEFAKVTDSDAWAILASTLMGAPRLAVAAADNKILLAFFILFGEFESGFGEQIRSLDTAETIAAFRVAFRMLEETLSEKAAHRPSEWLREGAARIGVAAPDPAKSDEPPDPAGPVSRGR